MRSRGTLYGSQRTVRVLGMAEDLRQPEASGRYEALGKEGR